jgi:SAM-dependent methyltransferase
VDEFRSASLQSWSTVAPAWVELISKVDRQLRRAAEWMVAAVDLQPGDRVLELAGGPGTISLAAAEAVGQDGRVTCTDFAEPMVEAARQRAAAEGAANTEHRVMDAEAIDLPDGAVDVVLCRMGYMLMADPAQAIRESARVLAPGGRLALAVWSDAQANPWAAIPMRAIMQHLGSPPPPPDAPGLFALADAERLRSLLTDAGLSAVRTELLDDVVEYESPEAWLGVTGRLAGPVRALLDNLDDDGRAAISAAVAQASAPFRQDDGRLSVPERMLVASARRG